MFDLKELKDSWGAPVVARQAVSKFSGGLLNPRTLANEDCLGTGPKGRFKLGKKVFYSVDSLIQWMRERSKEA